MSPIEIRAKAKLVFSKALSLWNSPSPRKVGAELLNSVKAEIFDKHGSDRSFWVDRDVKCVNHNLLNRRCPSTVIYMLVMY